MPKQNKKKAMDYQKVQRKITVRSIFLIALFSVMSIFGLFSVFPLLVAYVITCFMIVLMDVLDYRYSKREIESSVSVTVNEADNQKQIAELEVALGIAPPRLEKKCKKCHKNGLYENGDHCVYCGTKQEEALKICSPTCHTVLESCAIYCPKCGKDTRKKKQKEDNYEQLHIWI